MMKRVIITGASSMLGIATIKVCIKHGTRVLAIVRPNSKRKKCLPESNLLTVMECDLKELGDVNPDGQYDCCYHFGWTYTDGSTRDDPYLQLKNIEYTLAAVELAKRSGCTRFIGAGSQAEYGVHDDIIYENTSVDPVVSYGIMKYAAGKLARKVCDTYGITCIWTRTFSVYGTNDGENVMVSYAMRQFLHKEKAIFSQGLQYWDYLFEDDAGVYFYLLGKVEAESCIVNVASGDNRPLREFIYEMAEVLGDEFQYELSAGKTGRVFGIRPDIQRLRQMTGYIPKITFSQGISIIWNGFRER